MEVSVLKDAVLTLFSASSRDGGASASSSNNNNNSAVAAVKEAEAYLSKLRVAGASQVWRICADAFDAVDTAEVRFWCLQTLVDVVSQVVEGERAELRSRVLGWMYRDCVSVVDQRYPEFICGKLVQLVIRHIRLEFPVVWPDAFHNLLSLTRAIPASRRSVDYFCGVLDGLYDELISLEYPRSREETALATRVKDGMRELSIKDVIAGLFAVIESHAATEPDVSRACLESIARHVSWFSIDLALSPATFGVATSFFAVGPQASMATNESSRQRRENLVAGACAFVQAVVTKNMPSDAKLELLCHGIKIVDVLSMRPQKQPAALLETGGDDGIEDEAWTCLVAAACGGTLECLQDLAGREGAQSPAIEAGHLLLDTLVCRFFVGELRVGRSPRALFPLMQFTSQYTSYAKKLVVAQQTDPHCAADQRLQQLHFATLRNLHTIMTSLSACAMRDDDEIADGVIIFDEGYDDCDDEHLMRTEVLVNFRNVARILPAECAAHVRWKTEEVVRSIAATGAHANAASVENCLVLMYEIGQGAQEEYAKPMHGLLCEPVGYALTSATSVMAPCLSNPIISLIFMELCVRYYRLLLSSSTAVGNQQPCGSGANSGVRGANGTGALSGALQHFFGEHGVRCHDNTALAMRASYLLLRLMRSIRSHMGPYRQQLVPSLFDPLKTTLREAVAHYQREMSLAAASTPAGGAGTAEPVGTDTKDVKMYIYEVAGLVVGGSKDVSIFPPEEQSELVVALHNSIRQTTEEFLHVEQARGGGPAEVDARCTGVICAVLNAVGHLFSGMTEGTDEPTKAALCGVFTKFYEDVTSFFRLHPNAPALHESMCRFLHRSVSSFREAAIPFVLSVLPLLLSAPPTAQVEVMMLACQIIVELKAASQSLVEAFLPCVLKNIAQILDTASLTAKSDDRSAAAVTSEEDREVKLVQRAFYQLVQTALANAPRAFVCPTVAQHLEIMLNMLVVCARSHSWPACRKLCVSALYHVAIAFEKDRNEGLCSGAMAALPGLDVFLVNRIGGDAGLHFIFSGNLDLKDAESVNIFSDVANCQIVLARIFGDDFARYVTEVLQSYAFPTESISLYLSTLATLDANKIKRVLRSMATAHGKSTQGWGGRGHQ